jgi:hypothetical protein
MTANDQHLLDENSMTCKRKDEARLNPNALLVCLDIEW